MDQAIDTAKDVHVITYNTRFVDEGKQRNEKFSLKKSRRRAKFDIICSCRPQMEISSSGQTA